MTPSAASRLVDGPFQEEKVIAVCRDLLEEVGGKVSIGFVFMSADYASEMTDFLELIRVYGQVPLLIGSSCAGLVGVDIEREKVSGFSLLLLYLPETKIHLVEVSPEDVAAFKTPHDWHRFTQVPPEEVETWLTVVDPFGFPLEEWLARWSDAYPGVPTIGGLSSNSLDGVDGQDVFVTLNGAALEPARALMVGLKGGITVEPVVAQGCRPFGEPFTITKVEGNLILALGGKPAYTILSEAFETLTSVEKSHAQGNLFAGLASSEYLEDFKRGDFLIRTILGADAATGAIAVGAYPRVGQTFQWQIRDPLSADIDLRQQLRPEIWKDAIASLVFSCGGRGEELFNAPNHDAHVLAEATASAPSAGFFSNGEIGPMGNKSFVHGYSVVMAIFCPKRRENV